MPGGDRTGPEGRGPRTGRQAGDCDVYEESGSSDTRPRRGLGLGFRRGFARGPGRGRGLRFWNRRQEP